MEVETLIAFKVSFLTHVPPIFCKRPRLFDLHSTLRVVFSSSLIMNLYIALKTEKVILIFILLLSFSLSLFIKLQYFGSDRVYFLVSMDILEAVDCVILDETSIKPVHAFQPFFLNAGMPCRFFFFLTLR